MADVNWDLLSEDDLRAYSEKRYDDMSEDALRYVTDTPFETGDVVQTSAGRAATSSLRGVLDLAGGSIGPLSINKEKDAEEERRYRMMMETNPAAAISGSIGGSITDPFFLPAAFLAPVKVGGQVATAAARGATAGAAAGALEPVYSEYGDSRMLNVAGGAAVGGAFGGAVGWVGKLINANKAKLLEPPKEGEPLLLEWNGKQGVINSKGDFVDPDSGAVIKTAQQAEQEALTDLGLPKQDFKWNPDTARVELQETVTPELDLNLPSTLKGAKPRFVRDVVEFENDLDKAFYIIGGKGKSASHDAYMAWLQKVTGKSETELNTLAKAARKETIDTVKVQAANGELPQMKLSKTSGQLLEELRAPKIKVTPYTPPKVVTKTSFNDDDLAALEKVGLRLVNKKDGTVAFQDILNKRQWASKAVMQERLKGLGWDVQIPKKPKVKQGEENAQATEQLTREEMQAQGIPTQPKSVGAAGVTPSAQYGPDIARNVQQSDVEAFVLNPHSVQPRRVGIEEVSDPVMQDYIDRLHNLLYPSLQRSAKLSGTLRNIRRRGDTRRQQIINEFGNLAEFIIANPNRALTAEETAAVRPLVEMAKSESQRLMNKLADMVDQGVSFDSQEAAKMAGDLMYYEGINLWYKGTGTLASRALNARKLINKNIRENKPLKSIFPEVGC